VRARSIWKHQPRPLSFALVAGLKSDPGFGWFTGRFRWFVGHEKLGFLIGLTQRQILEPTGVKGSISALLREHTVRPTRFHQEHRGLCKLPLLFGRPALSFPQLGEGLIELPREIDVEAVLLVRPRSEPRPQTREVVGFVDEVRPQPLFLAALLLFLKAAVIPGSQILICGELLSSLDACRLRPQSLSQQNEYQYRAHGRHSSQYPGKRQPMRSPAGTPVPELDYRRYGVFRFALG
jgi:hypothetical protein